MFIFSSLVIEAYLVIYILHQGLGMERWRVSEWVSHLLSVCISSSLVIDTHLVIYISIKTLEVRKMKIVRMNFTFLSLCVCVIWQTYNWTWFLKQIRVQITKLVWKNSLINKLVYIYLFYKTICLMLNIYMWKTLSHLIMLFILISPTTILHPPEFTFFFLFTCAKMQYLSSNFTVNNSSFIILYPIIFDYFIAILTRWLI